MGQTAASPGLISSRFVVRTSVRIQEERTKVLTTNRFVVRTSVRIQEERTKVLTTNPKICLLCNVLLQIINFCCENTPEEG